jgi:hypothetical protein
LKIKGARNVILYTGSSKYDEDTQIVEKELSARQISFKKIPYIIIGDFLIDITVKSSVQLGDETGGCHMGLKLFPIMKVQFAPGKIVFLEGKKIILEELDSDF